MIFITFIVKESEDKGLSYITDFVIFYVNEHIYINISHKHERINEHSSLSISVDKCEFDLMRLVTITYRDFRKAATANVL